MSPAISVIMPVFNSQSYLEKAIISILDQSYNDFEFIIVDDGSTDLSRNIINKFKDSRIKKIYQQNQGYPNALNYTIKLAKGKYIARMDSDDISRPTRLEQQFEFLENNSNFVFVGIKFLNYITPSDKIIPKVSQKKNENIEKSYWSQQTWVDIIEYKRTFIDASVMFLKDAALKVGAYRNYLKSGQDVDLWLRLLERYEYAATINQPLYDVRIDPFSITSHSSTENNKIVRQLAIERKNKGSDRVMRGEAIGDLVPKNFRSNNKRRIIILFSYSKLCFKAGDFNSAGIFLKQALLSLINRF